MVNTDCFIGFRRSLETQMEAQRKKDTSKSASKRQQHSFAVTVNALKVNLRNWAIQATNFRPNPFHANSTLNV